RAGGSAGCRVRAALQSVPAHEADHAAQDSRQPSDHAGRGRGRSAGGRESAPRGRKDDPSEELRGDNLFPTNNIVIVGGGLAGLFCALKLAPRPVTLLTGAPLGAGASSVWAQGGIAAAVTEGDTPEAHARDTIMAGAGIVDGARALAMAREAPARIEDLLSYGVPVDRDLTG